MSAGWKWVQAPESGVFAIQDNLPPLPPEDFTDKYHEKPGKACPSGPEVFFGRVYHGPRPRFPEPCSESTTP